MTIELMDTAMPFWQVSKSTTRFWYTVTLQSHSILSTEKFLYSQLDNSWENSLHIYQSDTCSILFSCSGPSLCLFLYLILICLGFHMFIFSQSWYLNKIIVFSHWLLRMSFQAYLVPWVKLCSETCMVQENLKSTTGLRGSCLLSAEEGKTRFV